MNPYLSVVVLLGLGSMNVWFSRWRRLGSNHAAAAISRYIGLDRTRALLLGTGVMMLLMGLAGLALSLAGA